MRWRNVLLAVALVATASVGTAQAAVLLPTKWSPRPAAPTTAQRLVFAEEFSATAAGWDTCYPWWPKSSPGCTNEGNPDELQWYVPAGVTTTDGVLALTARKQTTLGTFRGTPKPYQYVSGMVQSRNRFSFQYGYAEFRMKLAPGQGMWDAAWLLPVRYDHKGEIDVFEGYGQAPRALALTYHSPTGQRFRKELADLPDLTAGFHTYGIDWEPTRLTWYLDGKALFTVNQPTPAEPMYLLANLAVAGRHTSAARPRPGHRLGGLRAGLAALISGGSGRATTRRRWG